jgi:hypothetical protein
MLQVEGRSDLFLRLEIIKKLLAVPIIIIGIFLGIKIMLIGMILISFIAYFINSYWSGRFIGYSSKEQIIDILPSFGVAALMAILVFLLNIILPFNYVTKLIIQLVVGAAFVIIFCELTKFRDYLFIKEIVIDKIKEIKKK